MTQKRILKEFMIGEISTVDRPAQTHAKSVLLKRRTQEDDMSNEDLKKQMEDLQKQLEKAKAEKEDLQKKYDDKEKMKKEEEEKALKEKKDKEMKKSQDKGVIYKSLDGTEYYSDETAALAKMLDAEKQKTEEIKKQNAELAKAHYHSRLEKRAGETMGNIVAESNAKVALLKAIDSLEEADQSLAQKMIEDINKSIGEFVKSKGHEGDGQETDSSSDAWERGLAKFCKENNLAIGSADAINKFMDSPEGRNALSQQ